MSQFQPTRRTLFGDLFTAVFGCVVAQKFAHVALPPAPTHPVVPVVDVIASPTTGITTFSYDSATGTMTTMDTSGKITTYCYDVHGRCLPST
jgi:hypothetical protein